MYLLIIQLYFLNTYDRLLMIGESEGIVEL